MTLNLLDQIGNWNPQLFREIKGRLKMGNMAIASALSLSAQLLLFMYYSAQIAVPSGKEAYPYHRFSLETTNWEHLSDAISRNTQAKARLR